jgi:hypothetical protein
MTDLARNINPDISTESMENIMRESNSDDALWRSFWNSFSGDSPAQSEILMKQLDRRGKGLLRLFTLMDWKEAQKKFGWRVKGNTVIFDTWDYLTGTLDTTGERSPGLLNTIERRTRSQGARHYGNGFTLPADWLDRVEYVALYTQHMAQIAENTTQTLTFQMLERLLLEAKTELHRNEVDMLSQNTNPGPLLQSHANRIGGLQRDGMGFAGMESLVTEHGDTRGVEFDTVLLPAGTNHMLHALLKTSYAEDGTRSDPADRRKNLPSEGKVTTPSGCQVIESRMFSRGRVRDNMDPLVDTIPISQRFQMTATLADATFQDDYSSRERSIGVVNARRFRKSVITLKMALDHSGLFDSDERGRVGPAVPQPALEDNLYTSAMHIQSEGHNTDNPSLSNYGRQIMNSIVRPNTIDDADGLSSETYTLSGTQVFQEAGVLESVVDLLSKTSAAAQERRRALQELVFPESTDWESVPASRSAQVDKRSANEVFQELVDLALSSASTPVAKKALANHVVARCHLAGFILIDRSQPSNVGVVVGTEQRPMVLLPGTDTSFISHGLLGIKQRLVQWICNMLFNGELDFPGVTSLLGDMGKSEWQEEIKNILYSLAIARKAGGMFFGSESRGTTEWREVIDSMGVPSEEANDLVADDDVFSDASVVDPMITDLFPEFLGFGEWPNSSAGQTEARREVLTTTNLFVRAVLMRMGGERLLQRRAIAQHCIRQLERYSRILQQRDNLAAVPDLSWLYELRQIEEDITKVAFVDNYLDQDPAKIGVALPVDPSDATAQGKASSRRQVINLLDSLDATKYKFWTTLITANIPFPLSFLLFRMHLLVNAGSVIFLKRGDSTAVLTFKYAKVNFKQDVDTNMLSVQVSFNSALIVMQPKNLEPVLHAYVKSYASAGGGGGGTTDLYPGGNQTVRDAYQHREVNQRYSIFVVAVGYADDPVDIFTDISGSLHDELTHTYGHTSSGNSSHYCSAATYARMYQWRPNPHALLSDRCYQQTIWDVSVCIQSSQFNYSKETQSCTALVSGVCPIGSDGDADAYRRFLTGGSIGYGSSVRRIGNPGIFK